MAHAADPNDICSSSLNLPFAEALYAEFLVDPLSVPEDWRAAFSNLAAPQAGRNGSATRLGPSFVPASIFNPPAGASHNGLAAAASTASGLLSKVEGMARGWRERGHLLAQIDPLGQARQLSPKLSPEAFGISEAELDLPLSGSSVPGVGSPREAFELLRATYGGSVGAQIAHIDDPTVRHWLCERMELTLNRRELSRDEEWTALEALIDGAFFEEFLQRKFLGAKRFSLEGSEGLLVLLNQTIECAGERGIAEIVLAMAHRGRLNVLTNVLHKPARQIFREFEDAEPERYLGGRGDVKYHLGHSSQRKTASGAELHLSLCFNPSHLEYVAPVALGRMRAKQERAGALGRELGLCVLIHGDAAFIGEGVSQEILNLSELPGYRTGGTLHVVVNNQIGFTTSPAQGRSNQYCTDVARMLDIPVFHVNGEDMSAVIAVARLSAEFRTQYQRDAVIDLLGYRRRGHNEGDEPSFTDPRLYALIADKRPVHELYAEDMIARGRATRAEVDAILEQRGKRLEEELAIARSGTYKLPVDPMGGVWAAYRESESQSVPDVDTTIAAERASELLQALCRLPENFAAHPKLARFFDARLEMAAGKRALDWSAGEALALASLAVEGTSVRLSGQDTERGTFSHRHAVLHDHTNGERFVPLQALSADQGRVTIQNSPLSEIGVLGFEYGYTLDSPDKLVLWEAQFGDFANTAQVIIDQFLVSAEDKWYRHSGLVLLLPHGFEGQGPEHSSARLERFLSLAVEDNMQIVNITTPANFFHALRRQVLRPWRKPLVVMSPKSLLRHPACVSPLEDFASGGFQRVIPESAALKAKQVKRVLLCSGKLYYELLERREKDARSDVAILRLEELYPFPQEQLDAALAPYGASVPLVWVQEEPNNMGAWRYLLAHIGAHYEQRAFSGISRPAAASPATGSSSAHKIEQNEVLTRAFAF
jgi:2-oxoglutarate dehydrogenase E1 component